MEPLSREHPMAQSIALAHADRSQRTMCKYLGVAMNQSVTSGTLTDSPDASIPFDASNSPRFNWQRCLPLVALLMLTTAAWLPLFLQRIHSHQPNVDDYFYAFLADKIWIGSVGVLHTGQTSPLVPTLAGPLVAHYGIDGGVFLQLPLLLLTVTGAYLLARTWVPPIPAAVTALAVGVNQAVIGYAVMIHFSIAVTGAIIWAFYGYVRSDHLREPRWCVVVGIAMAALLLSRSMAPSYALPLVLVLFIDVVLDARRRRPRWTTLFVPALVVVVLAGPWWLVSGHTALHYLFTAGYNTSTGFSSQSAGLTPSSIHQHINWFVEALAWPQSIALGVAILVSLLGVARYRRKLDYTSLWLLVLWTLFTVLILSSTGDNGSGFGLPVLAMSALVCGSIIGQFPIFTTGRNWSALAIGLVSAVLVVGLFAEGTGRQSFWWNGPPYRNEVLGAGGSWNTDLDALSSQVSRVVGDQPTLNAFGNAIMNGNSLGWTTRNGGSDLFTVTNSANSTKEAIAALPKATFVISGSSFAQYPPPIDEHALELAAEAHNFVPIRTWTFGSDAIGTTIVLWKHKAGSGASNFLIPEVKILTPTSGTVLSGNQFLAASVSGKGGLPIRVTKVEFFVSGGIFHNVPVETASFSGFGWLGGWNTARFPNGRYTVTCLAIANGNSKRSLGVTVQIDNK
jgi:hypothetical protein